MKTKLLIKEFVQDKNVGAIASTSSRIVEQIIDKINFENAEIIVEYGPGKGVITKMILDNMKPDAVLYVFEANKNFIDLLHEINDRRLFIINDDAVNANQILLNDYNIDGVDYIISTIPFTLIEKTKRSRIISRSFNLLKRRGQFITYQYSWLIFSMIKQKFKSATWELSLFSLPAGIIMVGEK